MIAATTRIMYWLYGQDEGNQSRVVATGNG